MSENWLTDEDQETVQNTGHISEKSHTDVKDQNLVDMVNKFLGESDNEVKKTGYALTSLLEKADQSILFLLSEHDYGAMDEEQKSKFEKTVDRKIKAYDFFKRLGINLYKKETMSRVRKMEKLRDRLVRQQNTFLSQLDGYAAKGNEAQQLDDLLPATVKDSQEYLPMKKWLEGQGAGSGEGLESQLVKAEDERRYGSHIHDLLQASIGKYHEKLNDADEEIATINQKLEDNPHDSGLLRQRTQLYDNVNVLNSELRTYNRALTTIGKKVIDADRKVGKIENQVSVKKVCLNNCEEAIYHLDDQIDMMKEYHASNDEMMVVDQHMVMVQQAYKWVHKTGNLNTVFSRIYEEGAKNVEQISQELQPENSHEATNPWEVNRAKQNVAQTRELERIKKVVREKRLYN